MGSTVGIFLQFSPISNPIRGEVDTAAPGWICLPERDPARPFSFHADPKLRSPNPMTISRALWIAAIAGGLALRLYLVLQPPLVTPDSLTRYEPIARNLAAGHGFSRAAAPPYAPDGFNQPGYPLFLAAIYLAAGEDRRAVVLAQFGLELLT